MFIALSFVYCGADVVRVNLVTAFKDGVLVFVFGGVNFFEAFATEVEAFGFLLKLDFLFESNFHLFGVVVELIIFRNEVCEKVHHSVNEVEKFPGDFQFQILPPFDFILHFFLLGLRSLRSFL